MRKLGKIILITIMLLTICTVTVFADMGSKPRVQIDIKNPPQEKYYLDLLYYTEYYDRYSNIDADDDYDDKMLALLTGYDDSGWVPAIASGTSLPMWGSLEPDENGLLFSDADILLHEVLPGHKTVFVGKGELRQYADELVCCGERFAMSEIENMAIFTAKVIVFSCGARYFEIKSKNIYNARKYLDYHSLYLQRTAEKESSSL